MTIPKVLLLLAVLLWPAAAHAWTVTSNFDAQDCNWRAAADNACLNVNSGVMQIRPSIGFNGTGGLYYYFDFPNVGYCRPETTGVTHDPSGQCGGFWNRSFPGTTSFWMRYRMFLGNDFLPSAFTKIIKISTGVVQSDWMDFVPPFLDFSRQVLVWDPQSGNQSDQRFSGDITKGQWVCVEQFYQINPVGGAATGVFQLYVSLGTTTSGSPVASHTSVVYRPSGDNTSLFDEARVMRQQGQGTMIMDDWAASSDGRIGCGPVASDTTPPTQVTGLLATPGNGQVQLSNFTANDNSGSIAVYNIRRATASGGPYTTIFQVPGGANGVTFSYLDTGRTNGTTYYYQVAAQDGVGLVGPLSATVSATPVAPVGGTPTLTAPRQVARALGGVSASPTVTFASNVAAASGLPLGIFWKGAVTITSITGCATWVDSGASRVARPVDGFLALYGGRNAAAGPCTITVNFSGAPTESYLYAAEYANVNTTGMWDSTWSSGTATSGTTVSSTSFAPTVSNGALIAFAVADDTDATAGTGFSARLNEPGESIILEDRIFTSSLGLTQAEASFSTAITKGAIIAGVMVPVATGGSPLTTVSVLPNGRYAINGVSTFLQGISYYDCVNYHTSDLDALLADGFNLFDCHVDDVLRNNGNTAYNPDGTLISSKLSAINTFISYLEARGAVALLNCTYADIDGSNTAAYVTNIPTALTSCINAFKSHGNVLFSIVNEHNLGSFARNHSQMSTLMTTARTACPSCLIHYSSTDTAGSTVADGGSHVWTSQAGSTVDQTQVNAELAHGINAVAPHDNRNAGWETLVTARYSNLRAFLDASGRANMPILMEEPAREGSGGLGSASAYFTVFQKAKLAGVAGIVFHTASAFDLNPATQISQFTGVEQAVSDGLAAALGSSATLTRDAPLASQLCPGTAADIGAAWDAGYTSHNAWQTVVGRCRTAGINLESYESYNGTSTANMYFDLQAPTFARSGAYTEIRLSFLAAPPNVTGYECRFGKIPADTIRITRKDDVASSPAVLSTTTGTTLTAGQTYGCERAGSTITALVNSVAVLSGQDSTYSQVLRPAFYGYSDTSATDVEVDNGSLGNLIAVTVTPPAITAFTPSTSGGTITYTGTISGCIVQTGQGETFYTLASGNCTTLARTWTTSDDFACVLAVDANGAANRTPADYRCADTDPFVVVADVTAPVISNISPATGTVLAAGISQRLISWNTNEAATCHLDTVNVGYDSMAVTSVTTATGGTSFSYLKTGLVDGASVTIYLACRDAAGNTGTANTTFSVSPPPADVTAPILSGGSPSGAQPAGTTQVTMTVQTNEAATCKYGTIAATAYAAIANTFSSTGGTTHTQTIGSQSPGTSWTFFVRCRDAALNANASDFTITWTITAAADVTPPVLSGGSPNGVLAQGTVSVTMQVTTSESSTCKYGTVAGTAYAAIASTFTTTGGTLHSQTIATSDGVTYTFFVRCRDVALNANTSDFTITWSVTTLPPDVSPPIRSAGSPSGTLVSGTTSVVLALTTNESATCKYGTIAGVPYASIANTFTTTGGTSHAQTLGSITHSTTYTYYVRCRDAALNANVTDFVITWATAVPPDVSPPVLSAGSPSGTLASQSSYTLSVTADEAASCRYATAPGTAYAAMTLAMTPLTTTVHTALLAGGLLAGQHSYYVRCSDGSSNVNATDFLITFTVLGVPPAIITNHAATLITTSQITYTNDVPTDDVAVTEVRLYLCDDTDASCTIKTVWQSYLGPATILVKAGLSPGLTYKTCVTALDADGNEAACSSRISTTTATLGSVDTELPSDVEDLVLAATYNQNVLTWALGFDTGSGLARTQIERCAGVGCTNYQLYVNVPSPTVTYTDNGITPSTSYSYRLVWVDLGGNASLTPATASVTIPALPDTIIWGYCPCKKKHP